MCVTNTTNRRAVALAAAKISLPPSLLKPVTLIPTAPSTAGTMQRATAASMPGYAVMTAAKKNPLPTNITARATTSTAVPNCISAARQAPAFPSFPYDRNHEEPQQKRRAKRRRKPQKPGKTAKMFDRHFVQHNYHDHSKDRPEDVVVDEVPKAKRRGGVTMSFPNKLHDMLEQSELDGMSHIISWQPHGRCFLIHKPKEFAALVMPKYFRQSKLTSFQRQLNLYGFQRLTRGPDDGGYYHELFLRGKAYLTKKMFRTKVNGRKFKAASSPDQEPDFYKMPPVSSVAESMEDCCATVTSESDHTCSSSLGTHHNEDVNKEEVGASSPPLTADISGTLYTSEEDNTSTLSPIPLDDESIGSEAPNMIQAVVASSAPNILDEVVDDVFFHESEQCSEDLLSFVEDWDYEMEDVSGSNAVDPDNNFDRLLERYLDDVVGKDDSVPV